MSTRGRKSASSRGQTTWEDAPEHPEHYQEAQSSYYARNARPPPFRKPVDRHDPAVWDQVPPSPSPPFSRRRMSSYTEFYDDSSPSVTYMSYEAPQSTRGTQPAGRLPPRLALKQLSDRLGEASDFYQQQLYEFRREQQLRGHDISDDALRRWLWSDWTGKCDVRIKEEFLSMEITISQQLRHVDEAVAAPWPEESPTKTRFEHSMRMLRIASEEVVRLAKRAMLDWDACLFLIVELRTAKQYADPEGRVHRHLFIGWGSGDL
ncbi:hypothetical protein FZEAL_6441 [Fusarium zealandicum]|uniref:Uncharacterized protein n=1 Tax=Fusarium zealandicum TaxID=1053134 RepID=A0A8H4UIM6_9HYPO|nr:hypothetical protein FZEAL_6441 [Fusarium zealandicum]